jgi:hypothetical protein
MSLIELLLMIIVHLHGVYQQHLADRYYAEEYRMSDRIQDLDQVSQADYVLRGIASKAGDQ